MYEGGLVSELPASEALKPDLKLAEVRGSLSLFSVSVDQHRFKP